MSSNPKVKIRDMNVFCTRYLLVEWEREKNITKEKERKWKSGDAITLRAYGFSILFFSVL